MRRFWRQPEKSSVVITLITALIAFAGLDTLSRHYPVLAYVIGGFALVCLVIIFFLSEGKKS